MRVAAVYDIHGNLPALEAVLHEIEGEAVAQIVVGGDVVPGPFSGECLAALDRLAIPVHYILGNGEVDTLAAHRGEELTRVPPPFRESLRWQASELSPAHLAELAEWPSTHRVRIDDLGEVLFCHATPRDDNEIFTRITPEERLRPIFEAPGAEIVVCGHTHMPFARSVGSVQVVNAGSVGMPFGEPGAFWALLSPVGVERRRTAYDLEAAADRIAASAYPSDFEIKNPPPESQMLEILEGAALR